MDGTDHGGFHELAGWSTDEGIEFGERFGEAKEATFIVVGENDTEVGIFGFEDFEDGVDWIAGSPFFIFDELWIDDTGDENLDTVEGDEEFAFEIEVLALGIEIGGEPLDAGILGEAIDLGGGKLGFGGAEVMGGETHFVETFEDGLEFKELVFGVSGGGSTGIEEEAALRGADEGEESCASGETAGLIGIAAAGGDPAGGITADQDIALFGGFGAAGEEGEGEYENEEQSGVDGEHDILCRVVGPRSLGEVCVRGSGTG